MVRTTPATGTVRWLDDVDPVSGNRFLCITPENGVPQDYEVEERPDGAYRLWKLDLTSFDLIYYDLTPWPGGHYRCDCPDAALRPGRSLQCKHARALRAALAALPL